MTLTNHNIEDLISLCRKHDRRAQLEVYNRYYKAMYNTSLRILKEEALAQDAMQEGFINAFTKLDSFQGDATFGSWLKRIIVNTSLNSYQKKVKRAETPIEHHLYALDDACTGVTEDHYANVKVKEVLNAMKALKDSYRIALSLHFIEGYDYEEMSAILNKSYANCRTTVSRAKESLRKLLVQNHE